MSGKAGKKCYASLSDEELCAIVSGSKGAEAGAGEELFSRYRDFIKAKVRPYFLVGGDSEDLIQEGMIGLYKAIRDFRPGRGASFETFARLCVDRQMATAVENLINKNAADKDAKMMKEATEKINAAPAAAPAPGAAPVKPAEAAPFDIGKFAGIFAALGMAVGMIGTALASLAKGIFALKWWQVILAFVGVMLVISGPAMVMAWLKLRRRNIAPLLNANGWAINASSKISIMFGETLTDIAKYPKLKLKDPYARKGLAPWKKWCISLASVVVVLAVLWVLNLFAWAGLRSPLPRYNKTEVVEEVVVEECVEVVADTVVVQ